MTLEEPVYIHPSSVLYHMNKEFIVYQSLEETSSRIYMKGIIFTQYCVDVAYCYTFCTFQSLFLFVVHIVNPSKSVCTN